MTSNDGSDVQQPQSKSDGSACDMLVAIQHELADIRACIDRRLADDRVKDKAYELLYAELDRLKRRATVLDDQSLYRDLILLHDRLASSQDCATSVETLSAFVESLRDELRDVLFRRDVHLISLGDDAFDPKYQQAVAVEDVASRQHDGKVLRTVRDGFVCGDVVLRPQEVVVGRMAPRDPGMPGDDNGEQ